jgi:hypothetical protein
MSQSTINQSSKVKQNELIPKNPQSLTLNFNPLTFLLMQRLLSGESHDFNAFRNAENRNDENED